MSHSQAPIRIALSSIPKSKIEKVDNLIFKKNEPSQFEKMLVTED
jgi:hypothetical protein